MDDSLGIGTGGLPICTFLRPCSTAISSFIIKCGKRPTWCDSSRLFRYFRDPHCAQWTYSNDISARSANEPNAGLFNSTLRNTHFSPQQHYCPILFQTFNPNRRGDDTQRYHLRFTGGRLLGYYGCSKDNYTVLTRTTEWSEYRTSRSDYPRTRCGNPSAIKSC